MSLKADGEENIQCRESCDIEISENVRKEPRTQKKTCRESRRYLIGFGMLTKTSKSLYVVHRE